MNEPALSLHQVRKSYGAVRAVDGISFDLHAGETLALLGPSGCGKSTLLALIAGLETPDAGTIRWQGRDLAEVPTHQRGFGLMFQDYALFPHMDVAGNVGFGLRYQALSTDDARARIDRLLRLVGLEGYGSRDVTLLSGGEQQRVALARSLAPGPKLLMLDEPLGALDRLLRERLLADLRAILDELSQTAVYVTHDQEEAFAIAQRVAVMRSGHLEQLGTPEAIYQAPASRFVAEFLGFDNFIPGSWSDGVLQTGFGPLPLTDSPGPGPLDILLRPDRASLEPLEDGLTLPGVLVEQSFRGSLRRLVLETDEGRLIFDLPAGAAPLDTGARLTLHVPRRSVSVFKRLDA